MPKKHNVLTTALAVAGCKLTRNALHLFRKGGTTASWSGCSTKNKPLQKEPSGALFFLRQKRYNNRQF